MTTEFIVEGRIVWGHPGKGQKATNMRTGQPKLNKHNQEYEEYSFGVAVDKQSFNDKVWPHIYQEAVTYIPNALQMGDDFSWKFKDADTSRDRNGKLYSEYEGRAGCMIVAIKTSAFAPQMVRWDGQEYVEITVDEIKCGDHVAVKCSCEFNGSNGVYINPEMVCLTKRDDEIKTSGANPEEAFAGYTPPTVVEVMQTAPMAAPAQTTLAQAPVPGSVPGQQPPVAPQAAAAPAAPMQAPQPAAPAQAPAAPGAMPPPAHDFVNNAGQQPAPAAYPPAAPMAAPAQAPAAPTAPGTPPMAGLPAGR